MPNSQLSPYILERILFFILFCNFSMLYAQSDSLAHKSYKELDSLYFLYKQNDPKKAYIYADGLYTKLKTTKNDRKIGEALYRKAFIFYKLAVDDSAFFYIDKSLDIGKKIKNDSLFLQNTCLKGNIYLAIRDYSKATNEYLAAKKIADRMGNIKDVLLLDHNIGLIKQDTKDFNEAIEIFLANLEYIKKHKELNLEEVEIISLVALIDTYLQTKNIKKAEEYINIGLQKSSLKKFKEKYLLFSEQEVKILHQKKQYKSSIQKAISLLKPLRDYGNEKHLVTLYFYLGKNYFEIEKCDSVKYYFEKIRILTDKEEEDVELPKLIEVYHMLGTCEAKAGNIEKSIEYHNLSVKFDKKNDSINTATNNELHKNYDIVPLKEEIEYLDDYGQEQKSLATLWYSISAVLVLSLLLFFFLYRKKQQQAKKRFQELLQTIDTLEQAKTQPLKTTASIITDESVLEILEGLKTFEEKEYYLRQDCTLTFVAKKLKTNTSYLSNVINTYKEKSFKAYLSELRINAALIRLKNDPKLRAYTIQAIAEEFGFKRQETFSKAFKTQTKMLPSKYIKSLYINNIDN